MELINPIIYALLAGVIYAAVGYLTRTGEKEFSIKKFLSTIATSIIVVFGMLETGQIITQASIEAQMGTYFMLTVLIGKGLDWLFVKINPPIQEAIRQKAISPDIKFTLQYLGDRIAPCTVKFTEVGVRITLWNFGDGKFGYYDTPGQQDIIHSYMNPGTYLVRAMAGPNMSESQEIIILGEPVPPAPIKESWLELLINWFKGLLGI